MVETFIAREGTQAGEVLTFIATAAAAGAAAVVPVDCLPVLTQAARCLPTEKGSLVFRSPMAQALRCGWGERAVAIVLLLGCVPLLATVALLVLVFDGRPVLFRQARFGCNGLPFTVLKFRTMKRRSERLHTRLQRRLGREGWLFKLERDPRVTRLGAMLRHTFIDELPQLVNVARGQMRFIGPRPLPASDQAHYTQPCHALRLKGMPGMTGLWQVSGRNRLTFDEMCLLDYGYLCNQSLWVDLQIAMRTMGVIYEQICLNTTAERGGEGRGGAEGARCDHAQRDDAPKPP